MTQLLNTNIHNLQEAVWLKLDQNTYVMKLGNSFLVRYHWSSMKEKKPIFYHFPQFIMQMPITYGPGPLIPDPFNYQPVPPFNPTYMSTSSVGKENESVPVG